MADFLAAVKTVRKEIEVPEPALKEVYKIIRPAEQVTPILKGQDQESKQKPDKAETPEQALEILKRQPDSDSLIRTLEQIRTGFAGSQFNIHIPGPRQAQIINTIVSLTLPNFWSSLDKHDKSLLLDCLRSVAGLSAIIARLRLLSERAKDNIHELAEVYIVAKSLFVDDDLSLKLWSSLLSSIPSSGTPPNDTKRQMVWKEFVGLIASGKVISTIAQVEDCLREHEKPVKTSWISTGSEYAAWLGRTIAHFLGNTVEGNDVVAGTDAAAAQLLSKAFSIGYPIPLVRSFMISLVPQTTSVSYAAKAWASLVNILDGRTRRQLLDSTLRWLSTLADDEAKLDGTVNMPPRHIPAFTALIAFLCDSHESMFGYLMDVLRNPNVASSIAFQIRRASIAYLSDRKSDELHNLLETSMDVFSDQMFINHAPILQQESLAQILLLCAGYAHRKAPAAVLMAVRSSSQMQGVSNRLDSTNRKARWLGMVVGTALSTLVDKEGSRIDFGTEDMQTSEAKWYQELVGLSDPVGAPRDLDALLKSTGGLSKPRKRAPIQSATQELPILNGKQTFGPPRPPQPAQTEVIGEKLTELLDEYEDDEDDPGLKPYAKPDSDPEDSDEDATLVNRKKAKAPVYIRDLMRMLKDDKDHDRFQMAIKHAPALIRRKSSFGAEVRDHAEELALMLCDLQDPFSTDDFDELKLQALIAVLLSDVQTIAPWLSKQAFVGDYGLGQRCIMLSALGLGGRELAGFKDLDNLDLALPESATTFPSKRLPDRLHTIYSPTDGSVKYLHAASENMQHQLLRPLALSAADQTTSHLNAVKVRTFSSRMDVERTKRKPTANELAKIFGSHFFFPLVTRYQQEMAAYGGGSVFASAPFVLVTFLKTLALLLHASGPATFDLPEIATAFWDLALSLRVPASADLSVLEAVLFSLLTLLEVNSNAKERLAQENAQQLAQTQQWAEMIFEKIGGGEMAVEGSTDEKRVRTLAAGVLVQISEVVQERQKMLMGNLR